MVVLVGGVLFSLGVGSVIPTCGSYYRDWGGNVCTSWVYQPLIPGILFFAGGLVALALGIVSIVLATRRPRQQPVLT